MVLESKYECIILGDMIFFQLNGVGLPYLLIIYICLCMCRYPVFYSKVVFLNFYKGKYPVG